MFLRAQAAFPRVIQTIIKLCISRVKRASKCGFFLPKPVLHHHCRASAQRPLAELLNVHPHQNPTWLQRVWQNISRLNPPWDCLLISPSFRSLMNRNITGNRSEQCLEREESGMLEPQIRATQGSSNRWAEAAGHRSTTDSSRGVTEHRQLPKNACEEQWKRPS